MKIKCRIVIEMDNKENAEAVQNALKLDNKGYIKSKIVGDKLIAETNCEDIGELLHTLDDYLACLSIAFDAVSIGVRKIE